ncbi:MAG: hypothetical protein LBI20_00215 [Holosporales bacterium]|nr:hypothetical protein [Holosporales bacterium]
MNRKLFTKHLLALLTLGVFMIEPGSATTDYVPGSWDGVRFQIVGSPGIIPVFYGEDPLVVGNGEGEIYPVESNQWLTLKGICIGMTLWPGSSVSSQEMEDIRQLACSSFSAGVPVAQWTLEPVESLLDLPFIFHQSQAGGRPLDAHRPGIGGFMLTGSIRWILMEVNATARPDRRTRVSGQELRERHREMAQAALARYTAPPDPDPEHPIALPTPEGPHDGSDVPGTVRDTDPATVYPPMAFGRLPPPVQHIIRVAGCILPTIYTYDPSLPEWQSYKTLLSLVAKPENQKPLHGWMCSRYGRALEQGTPGFCLLRPSSDSDPAYVKSLIEGLYSIGGSRIRAAIANSAATPE